ncbi:MAG TPA: sialidase family protein [Acidimicrobiia bacterium]
MTRLLAALVAVIGVLALAGGASAKPVPVNSFTDFTVAATPPNPAGTNCPGSPLCYNGAAEPAIGVTPTGRFYASSENGLGGGTLAWTSADNGLHYTSTPSPNDVSTGSGSVGKESGLEPGGGDTDVAIATAPNAQGNYNAYVVSLTVANIDVSTSTDNGVTWSLNPAAALPIDDRPWAAATGASKVCISYLTALGILLPQVGLHVQCSNDAGHTFTQVANAYDTSPVGLAASQGGSRSGNLVIDPSNPSFMYTVFAYENIEDGPNPNAFLHNVGVAVSSDGGVTWHDYSVKINPDITAKYDNQFVNVAVDKSGVVYVAYSDNHGIFYQYSTDHGQTFSAPVQVSQGTDTAVMPWLAAGEGGKIDLVYYQAVGYSGNPEVAGASVPWKVVMAQSLAAASPLPGFSYTTVNPVVHHGGVCEGGALCTGNRDLLDDFGVEASPTTGFASIVYSDDQYQNDANHKPNATFNCTAADSDTSTCDHTNVATQTASTRIFTVKGK